MNDNVIFFLSRTFGCYFVSDLPPALHWYTNLERPLLLFNRFQAKTKQDAVKITPVRTERQCLLFAAVQIQAIASNCLSFEPTGQLARTWYGYCAGL